MVRWRIWRPSAIEGDEEERFLSEDDELDWSERRKALEDQVLTRWNEELDGLWVCRSAGWSDIGIGDVGKVFGAAAQTSS